VLQYILHLPESQLSNLQQAAVVRRGALSVVNELNHVGSYSTTYYQNKYRMRSALKEEYCSVLYTAVLAIVQPSTTASCSALSIMN
jgi:hypothetical protein